MLREHVEKGDPRDVANFCMFLWARGEGIAAAPEVAAGWNPISTAPKDGRNILAIGKIYGSPFCYECNWNGVEWYHGFGDAWSNLMPSHWMPLPAPPADRAAQAACTGGAKA
jgi:hypothetical protein